MSRNKGKISKVIVHPDGSCDFNGEGKPGGWAFVARFEGARKIRYGYAGPTTSQQMELVAITRALEFVELSPHPLRIFSDSYYAVMSLTSWWMVWERQGWKTKGGKDVDNLQLIVDAVDLIRQHNKVRPVMFTIVKGHSGIQDNEIADMWAGRARKERITNWKD